MNTLNILNISTIQRKIRIITFVQRVFEFFSVYLNCTRIVNTIAQILRIQCTCKTLNLGNSASHTISAMECITIPDLENTWVSIKISGSASSSCVELHDDDSCGGNAVQLRPGYPYLDYLFRWGYYSLGDPAIHPKSVSLCGRSCPLGGRS